MKILAIETSCDETAVAVLEVRSTGSGQVKDEQFNVLSHELYSQASKHAEYGGVYPNLAKRLHSQNLIPLLTEVLRKSGFENPKLETLNPKQTQNPKLKKIKQILEREPELYEQLEDFLSKYGKPEEIDVIAVTQGPGLEPALWVGLNFAKALSLVWDLPLVPVDHMEGHLLSVLVDGEEVSSKKSKAKSKKLKWPAMALLVSGGHTELVLARGWGDYEILGATRDDAVGEAFDKAARVLGLPYPGGPEISRLAEKARNSNTRYIRANDGINIGNNGMNTGTETGVSLPRPMIDSDDYDFSFSGLKTAVLYFVREHQREVSESLRLRAEIAREFEDAAVDVLIAKTKRALTEHAPKTLIAGGGVIANKELRRRLTELVKAFPDVELRIPTRELALDNAVMIGIAGYFHARVNNKYESAEVVDIRAQGNRSLAERR